MAAPPNMVALYHRRIFSICHGTNPAIETSLNLSNYSTLFAISALSFNPDRLKKRPLRTTAMTFKAEFMSASGSPSTNTRSAAAPVAMRPRKGSARNAAAALTPMARSICSGVKPAIVNVRNAAPSASPAGNAVPLLPITADVTSSSGLETGAIGQSFVATSLGAGTPLPDHHVFHSSTSP